MGDPPAQTSSLHAAVPRDLRVVATDGVTLHVRQWAADPARRPFLLVHGLSSNACLWAAVATALAAAGHPVVAVDLRSHGESDAPDEGYDTATAAADVAAVAERLDIGDAIVVGQSWGGNVVVEVAAHHPGVAAALALIDGGWMDPAARFPTWEACEAALRPPDIDGTKAAAMRAYISAAHPLWGDWAIDATLANLAVHADGTVTRRLTIPHHMQIVRSMWEDPPRLHYDAVSVPVLLVPAISTDPLRAATSRAYLAIAADALGNATIREYPGADHDIHAQHPTQLAADLLALAERVDAAVDRVS